MRVREGGDRRDVGGGARLPVLFAAMVREPSRRNTNYVKLLTYFSG